MFTMKSDEVTAKMKRLTVIFVSRMGQRCGRMVENLVCFAGGSPVGQRQPVKRPPRSLSMNA